MDGLKSPNGGGGGRPRPFAIVAFWAGFVLAENRGDTVGSSQPRHFHFALVLGSLGSLSMMNGVGLLFLQKRHSLRPENGAEWPQQGQSRYCFAKHGHGGG